MSAPTDLAIPILPSRSIPATTAFYRQLGFDGGAQLGDLFVALGLLGLVDADDFRVALAPGQRQQRIHRQEGGDAGSAEAAVDREIMSALLRIVRMSRRMNTALKEEILFVAAERPADA